MRSLEKLDQTEDDDAVAGEDGEEDVQNDKTVVTALVPGGKSRKRQKDWCSINTHHTTSKHIKAHQTHNQIRQIALMIPHAPRLGTFGGVPLR